MSRADDTSSCAARLSALATYASNVLPAKHPSHSFLTRKTTSAMSRLALRFRLPPGHWTEATAMTHPNPPDPAPVSGCARRLSQVHAPPPPGNGGKTSGLASVSFSFRPSVAWGFGFFGWCSVGKPPLTPTYRIRIHSKAQTQLDWL